jgi:hypothetical protein
LRKTTVASAVSEIASLPMKDLLLVHALMDLKLIERKSFPNFFFLLAIDKYMRNRKDQPGVWGAG